MFGLNYNYGCQPKNSSNMKTLSSHIEERIPKPEKCLEQVPNFKLLLLSIIYVSVSASIRKYKYNKDVNERNSFSRQAV